MLLLLLIRYDGILNIHVTTVVVLVYTDSDLTDPYRLYLFP